MSIQTSRFSDDVVFDYIGTDKERKNKINGNMSMAVSVLAEGIGK